MKCEGYDVKLFNGKSVYGAMVIVNGLKNTFAIVSMTQNISYEVEQIGSEDVLPNGIYFDSNVPVFVTFKYGDFETVVDRMIIISQSRLKDHLKGTSPLWIETGEYN